MRFLLALALVGCSSSNLESRVAKLEAELETIKKKGVDPRRAREAAVVGKEAKLEVESWLQGEGTLDGHKATLLVFFETWCPHCKRELPELQAEYEALKGEGLEIIGITRLTRDTSEADLQAFIDAGGLTYPIAKDDGATGSHYEVSGVPAAALVKNGKIVWRGGAGALNSEMLRASLN